MIVKNIPELSPGISYLSGKKMSAIEYNKTPIIKTTTGIFYSFINWKTTMSLSCGSLITLSTLTPLR